MAPTPSYAISRPLSVCKRNRLYVASLGGRFFCSTMSNKLTFGHYTPHKGTGGADPYCIPDWGKAKASTPLLHQERRNTDKHQEK